MVRVVAIYSDEGASEVGVASLCSRIKQQLGLMVKTVNAQSILDGVLDDCVMLVIPGGRDLPYCAKLNGKGNQQIRQFVARGGVYLGICAGAYYACEALDFQGRDYDVKGSRELALFAGIAIGSLPHLTKGHYYDEELRSKAIVPLYFTDGTQADFYYHGGCFFQPYHQSEFEALAHYADGNLAIVTGQFGKGHYVLSGVHFELQTEIYRQKVVNMCKTLADKWQEQSICRHLGERYGEQIWQILRKKINP